MLKVYNTLTKQKEEFKIEDFINESKEYSGKFFEDIDKYDFDNLNYKYFSNDKKSKD